MYIKRSTDSSITQYEKFKMETETILTQQILLKEYLITVRPYKVIFNSYKKNKKDPFLITLENLLFSEPKTPRCQKVLEEASALDFKKADHNFKLMFLNVWSNLLDFHGELEKAITIKNLSASLVSKKTDPLVRIIAISDKIEIEGTMSTNYKLIEKDLINTLGDEKRGAALKIDYMLNLSRIGYAFSSEKIFRKTLQLSKKNHLYFYAQLGYFIQLIETGHLEKALHLRKSFLNLDQFINKATISVNYNFYYWDCLLHQFNDLEFDIHKFDNSNYKEELKKLIKVHELLKKGNPEQALILGKNIYSFVTKRNFSNFAEYTILRTELASKNIQAAKNILTILKAKREHYLDDFFLARIYLLEKKRDEANYYYNKTLKECKKFNAEKRLDVELTFAYEINLVEFKYLTDQTKAKSSIIKEKLKLLKPDFISKQTSLVGESNGLKKIKEAINKFSNLDTPVLITGETGTGKEVIAKLLHEKSNRSKEPFIPINCGAISESLLQSELFGHKAGAFTGAITTHKGIFETAGKGTVFLDEIGEVSEKIQVALLRVLETLEIRPIGSAKAIPYHCRILAATNAPLEKLVKEKKIRQDLYYRLKRLEIKLPPLRERGQDIILLTKYFLRQNRTDDQTPVISENFRAAILKYPWPGNIRELKNEIEKLVILNSGKLYYDQDDLELTHIENDSTPNIEYINKIETPKTENIDHNLLDIAKYLKSGNGQIRRLSRIKELFKEHKILTRKEIAHIEKVSTRTAGLDLKKLCVEKFIKSVKPNNSIKLQYFEYLE